VNYRISRPLTDGGGETNLVNVRRLKPATDPTILSQLAREIAADADPVMNENKDIRALPELVNDAAEEYEAEEILDKRKIRNKLYYLVKWKGYHNDSNTWEPIEHLVNSPELVAAFEATSVNSSNRAIRI
jgi:hypothetical protein